MLVNSPIAWYWTVVVEEVVYTFELCVIFCTSELCVVERFSYGPRGGPTHFGGFVQVLQTVQVAVLGRILARPFGKFIKFTLNKIFEYVEMTI